MALTEYPGEDDVFWGASSIDAHEVYPLAVLDEADDPCIDAPDDAPDSAASSSSSSHASILSDAGEDVAVLFGSLGHKSYVLPDGVVLKVSIGVHLSMVVVLLPHGRLEIGQFIPPYVPSNVILAMPSVNA